MTPGVLTLWLWKLHLSTMNMSAAKLRFTAQVQKESDHAKTLSEKASLNIDTNTTSQYMLTPTTTQSSIEQNHRHMTLRV